MMVPHHGLTHLKEYDIKDRNVELIGTEIDHKVNYNSEATEPAREIVLILFWYCFQREFKPTSCFGTLNAHCALHI